MSAFRNERNRRSLERLRRALPAIFPGPVLVHALARPWIPPTPRLAIESYWNAHPIRADRLARALAGRNGAPEGWRWRVGETGDGLAATFRMPPAPYREKVFARGPGWCRICGGLVFRMGWHRNLWGEGPNRRASWHACCVAAWKLWTAPSEHGALLKRVQRHRCRQTGKRLLRTAEVDHRVPLFRVWRECRDRPWPELLGFWGVGNLQMVNREAHIAKCGAEAAGRALLARATAALPPVPPFSVTRDAECLAQGSAVDVEAILGNGATIAVIPGAPEGRNPAWAARPERGCGSLFRVGIPGSPRAATDQVDPVTS